MSHPSYTAFSEFLAANTPLGRQERTGTDAFSARIRAEGASIHLDHLIVNPSCRQERHASAVLTALTDYVDTSDTYTNVVASVRLTNDWESRPTPDTPGFETDPTIRTLRNAGFAHFSTYASTNERGAYAVQGIRG